VGGYVSNAGLFLVDLVLGLYVIAVLLRLLLQLVRADFYNPISQAIVTVTNPPLRFLRRWIPPARQIDSASVVLLFTVQFLNTLLIVWIVRGGGALPGLLLITIAELLQRCVYVFLFAIILLVIASWVAPGSRGPAIELLQSLCRPLLRPAQRLAPPLGGIDLSPFLIGVALQLAGMLLIAPLRDLGWGLL
jgi:YggT family protein